MGGSGTTGQAALELNRNFVLVDQNKQAIDTMKKRFANFTDQDGEKRAVHFVKFRQRPPRLIEG